MKRRSFIGTTTGAAALFTGGAGCGKETGKTRVGSPSLADIDTLAGRTLEEIREQYRYDLFDDFLPFMDTYVIDHEYGGFMCTTDRDGTNISTDKSTYYEGRGSWVYSYLYNNIDANPKYLEVARKSLEFVLKHKPTGDNLWPSEYTKVGKALDKGSSQIAGDMNVCFALQEYSRATGEEQYWDMAKEIFLKCLNIYDTKPGYGSVAAKDGKPALDSPRILGNWFDISWLATCMLEKRSDPDIKAISDRCIDAIMIRHYNPDYKLICYYLNHDMSPIDNDWGQRVSMDATEHFWMVLYEAARRKDKQLFDKSCEYLQRHMEVFWDDVYNGFFLALEHVDNNIWNVNKAAIIEEEALISTLFIIEHNGAQWAKDWFAKIYNYAQETFPLKKHGFALWKLYTDRKMTFVPHYDRIENYHHPRHLMFGLQTIERIIKNGGKISGLFA